MNFKNTRNILTVCTAKRAFRNVPVVFNEKNNSNDWNDFIGSLSNTKKTAAVYNKPNMQNKNKNNKERNFRNNSKFNNSNNSKRFNNTNRKPGNQDKSPAKLELNETAKVGEKKEFKTLKKQNLDVDLSVFDSPESSGGTKSNTNSSSFSSSGYNRNSRFTQRKANPVVDADFNPDKVISGHSYGVKEYKVELKSETTARRLSYKAIKNEDKVVLGTAMKFFKSHSNYTQPEVFLNPNMLFDISRECMLNVPRMINSKEHALRDAGFEVYKKLANDYKLKTEKILQIKRVQEWEELPEGFNLNDPCWDVIERKHMVHSLVNKGSTYEYVHKTAENAVFSDDALKLDAGRIDSLLNGQYDQDYLGNLGLNTLSDFQNKFKGIYAPNVVENLYQSSKILKTALNNSPAFTNHPERKVELFEYMSLLKPTNRILEKKKEILGGHKPGKANA